MSVGKKRKNYKITEVEVQTLYKIFLGREPDKLVIDNDMASFLRLEDLKNYILSSEEFNNYSRPSLGAPLSTLFDIAYGRVPTDGELDHMRKFVAGAEAESTQDRMRAVVMAFPRHDFPTPLTVRFTKENLRDKRYPETGMHIAVDKFDWSVSISVNFESYESHLTKFMRSALREGMHAMDMGANIGFHTLEMSRMVGQSGKVYAFEPNSENCRLILISIIYNAITNIELFPVGLSNKNGSARFSPEIGSNGGFMDDESETLYHPNCIIIPTLRLDSIIEDRPIDFIKIDVEGAEFLAMLGAENSILRYKPVIVSEFSECMLQKTSKISGREYLEYMINFGYTAYTMGVSGPVEKIQDPVAFMNRWSDYHRIEDIAFMPEGSSDLQEYFTSRIVT